MSTTLVFDGDCGFCTTSVGWLARLRLSAGTVIAYQHADLPALGLTSEQCAEKLQLVAADGRISSGHEAVAQLLLGGFFPYRVLGRLLLAPGISWVAARGYAWVSAHRMSLPGGTPACAIPASE